MSDSKLQELSRDIERMQRETGTYMDIGQLKAVNYGTRRSAKLVKRAKELAKREVSYR